MREIVFDTETTGLDPKTGDRMVEIGCIEMVNLVPTGATYHAYFNPERDMQAGAEAVHGLSAAFLSDKPLFREAAQELLDFIGDSPLVAHNAGFDFGFLNAELALIAMEPVCTTRMVDTVAIARKRHPGAKLSLDALCSRYGIDRSHRVKHGALLDSQLLADVYIELIGGRQAALGLVFGIDPFHLGIIFLTNMELGYLTPTRADFEHEQARFRGIHCYVQRGDGEEMVGSARDSRR